MNFFREGLGRVSGIWLTQGPGDLVARAREEAEKIVETPMKDIATALIKSHEPPSRV